MRSNAVQGRGEVTMTHTGETYLILSLGGEPEIMCIKNELCTVPDTDSINGINCKEYPRWILLNTLQKPHACKSKLSAYVPSYEDNDILLLLTNLNPSICFAHLFYNNSHDPTQVSLQKSTSPVGQMFH